MNIRWLLHRNIRYFARYYRLVAMAVVITVAVIVGSLVVRRFGSHDIGETGYGAFGKY